MDWGWIWSGFVFFVKTFLFLSLISAVTLGVLELFRLVGKDDMVDRIYFVVGHESGEVWHTVITSNNSSMSEEEALHDFKRMFGEDGYIEEVLVMGDWDD